MQLLCSSTGTAGGHRECTPACCARVRMQQHAATRVRRALPLRGHPPVDVGVALAGRQAGAWLVLELNKLKQEGGGPHG